MTLVFIPKETRPGEHRVAATPETVARMVKAGLEVIVEENAGLASHFSDESYRASGAHSSADAREAYARADLILKVDAPEPELVASCRRGAACVSFLMPNQDEQAAKAMQQAGLTSFAMNLVPRITRAQKMDALSSQANIAGYKAVLVASAALTKYFPLMMTAAGTVKPARVVVFGAGVAGLQAIATAKRLGAIVEATDIRAAAKEQVESLGGRFIEVSGTKDGEDQGGYAREASEEYKRKQAEAVAESVGNADVVITTALVPGRRAPVLLGEDMMARMRPGAVVVDLAVAQGGNCAWSRCGETVVRDGITIIGEPNLPATVATHASELYARNVYQVVDHLVSEGQLEWDFEDEITAGSVAVHGGEIRSTHFGGSTNDGGQV